MILNSYTKEISYNLKLSYPIILGLLGHTLVGMIDNIMVGKLDPTNLAAVSLGNSFIFIAMSIGIGFSAAITPVVAEAHSRNDNNDLRKSFVNGFLMCLILGVFLYLAILLFKPLLFMLDQPTNVVDLAIPYLEIVAASLVPLLMFQALKQYSDGLSLTANSMYATVLANIVNVIVNYVYESKYPSSSGGNAITDSRSVSVLVQHSLIKMPDTNYRPRLDDTRVGFFTTQSNHMTSIDQVNYRDFINRWRLEKKDPDEHLSEPIKPITFWIENTTPIELRNIIKDGVESWNIAFEKAGFKNAIQVKVQPDTADWDAGDIRYNVLRWTSSPNPPWGGYGPSFVNPRTGEILGADIMLEWTYITNRIIAKDLFVETETYQHDHNHNNCYAAKYQQIENFFGKNYIKSFNLSNELEEDLVKQSLKRLVLHEVGHTLGLTHNFKGSLLLSNDELNDKNIVNEKGICSSVMEYPAINIAKNPDDQGLYFDIKPGVYDRWAIQFGYSVFLDNEDEEIEKILSKSTNRELAFANDAFDMRSAGKGTDPDAMIYDLARDPLNHSLDKIEMINRIVSEIKDKYTKDNDTYEELYRSYRTLLFSYYQALNIVTRQIGGVKVDLSHTNQESTKKPFESVDIKTQKKAMQILSDYAFSNKILLEPEIFPYLQKQRRGFSISADPEIHQRILTYQKRLLDHLLNRNVLLRITNSTKYGNNYELSYYMIDLRKSIFESDFNTNISTIRQNLQVEYVNRLIGIASSKSRYDNFSKASAFYNLSWLKRNLNTSTGNLSTKQHKEYILFLIESELFAKK